MDLKNASGGREARASQCMRITCMWLSESLVLKGMRWGRPGCWISQSSRLPEQTEVLKENAAPPTPGANPCTRPAALKQGGLEVNTVRVRLIWQTKLVKKDRWHCKYLRNTLLSMCPWYLFFFWILIVYENYTPKPGFLYTSVSKNGKDSMWAYRIQSASPDHLVFPHIHIHIAQYINNYTVKRTQYLQV